MPARSRCAGEWIAPDDRMTSRAAELSLAPADPCLHADAAQPIEQQCTDLRIGGYRQVLAHTRAGIEITDRCRHPALIHVRDGDREIPVLEFRILIDQELVAGSLERLTRRLGVFRPQIGEDAANRNAPFIAVPGTIEVHVALDLLEEGQHAVPVPTGGATRVPLVVVGRRAAVGELAVDRRTTAQHARLFIGAQLRSWLIRPVVRNDLGGDLQRRPCIGRVQISGARIGIEDRCRHLAMRRVHAGFQQQHLV